MYMLQNSIDNEPSDELGNYQQSAPSGVLAARFTIRITSVDYYGSRSNVTVT